MIFSYCVVNLTYHLIRYEIDFQRYQKYSIQFNLVAKSVEMDNNNVSNIIGDESRKNLILDYSRNNGRVTIDATVDEITRRARALGVEIPKTSKCYKTQSLNDSV